MSGVTRLTMALAVIMIEVSSDVHMLLPVLVAVMTVSGEGPLHLFEVGQYLGLEFKRVPSSISLMRAYSPVFFRLHDLVSFLSLRQSGWRIL